MAEAGKLSKPIPLMPERLAAQRAIEELEGGEPCVALEVLRAALSRRQPPQNGPDRRSTPVIRLRAYIEQAICELEHGCTDFALRALQSGMGSPKET